MIQSDPTYCPQKSICSKKDLPYLQEESPEFVQTEEEDEEDFIIIRDQTPSPEPEIISQAPTAPSPEEEPDEEQVNLEFDWLILRHMIALNKFDWLFCVT